VVLATPPLREPGSWPLARTLPHPRRLRANSNAARSRTHRQSYLQRLDRVRLSRREKLASANFRLRGELVRSGSRRDEHHETPPDALLFAADDATVVPPRCTKTVAPDRSGEDGKEKQMSAPEELPALVPNLRDLGEQPCREIGSEIRGSAEWLRARTDHVLAEMRRMHEELIDELDKLDKRRRRP
jgi:hypothetical protein